MAGDAPSSYSYHDLAFVVSICVAALCAFVTIVLLCVIVLVQRGCGQRACCCFRLHGKSGCSLLSVLFYVLLVVAGCFLYLVVLAAAGFDKLPTVAAGFIGVLPLFLSACAAAAVPPSVWGFRLAGDDSDASTSRPWAARLRHCWPWLVLGLLLAVLFSFVFVYTAAGICFSSQPFHLNSRLQRRYMDSYCPQQRGRLCHVYLTLPENCSSAMIVTYHTAQPCRSSVRYGPGAIANASLLAATALGASHYMQDIDESRYVHFVPLLDLQPDTLYSFAASESCDHHQLVYQFRTCPYTSLRPVSAIFAGDCGTGPGFTKIAERIVEHEPYFAVIGGDISYANGMPTCYRVWDDWLSTWQKVTTRVSADGLVRQLTPLLLAIGNHEAGGLNQPRSNVPFYLPYFLQELRGVDNVAEPAQRQTYHYHVVNEQAAIFALDSWVTAPSDEQSRWLSALLDDELSFVRQRTASYHMPMYPSASMSFNDWFSSDLRNSWSYLFADYGFRVNFEHHEHTFKLTQPVVGMQVNTTHGVVYAGDGSFGVALTRALGTKHSELFVERGVLRHFWHVVYQDAGVNYTAYNEDGDGFYQFAVANDRAAN